MIELSQDELKLIRAHPLSKGLENFRTTFQSRFVKQENTNVREVIDKVITEASDKGKWAILDSHKIINRRQKRRILYLTSFWLFKASQRLELSTHGLGMGFSAATLLPFTLGFPQTKNIPKRSPHYCSLWSHTRTVFERRTPTLLPSRHP